MKLKYIRKSDSLLLTALLDTTANIFKMSFNLDKLIPFQEKW